MKINSSYVNASHHVAWSYPGLVPHKGFRGLWSYSEAGHLIYSFQLFSQMDMSFLRDLFT